MVYITYIISYPRVEDNILVSSMSDCYIRPMLRIGQYLKHSGTSYPRFEDKVDRDILSPKL